VFNLLRAGLFVSGAQEGVDLKAICPRCGKIHEDYAYQWTGNSRPRIYCRRCLKMLEMTDSGAIPVQSVPGYLLKETEDGDV
jgi:late competence protein required for DNA uptake (superfamily II DNA/RNA helicase)